jgi:hypothetical protein
MFAKDLLFAKNKIPARSQRLVRCVIVPLNSPRNAPCSGFDMENPTSTMSVEEGPVPVPGEGEVLVKLTLRPVNPAGEHGCSTEHAQCHILHTSPEVDRSTSPTQQTNISFCTVNADIFSLMGVYPGFQPAEGVVPVPGLEGTGVVEAVGSNATKFAPGQRVVGAPFASVQGGNGTWQRYIVAPESCLVAVPDSVSEDAAAQFFVNPVTVYGMLEVLGVPEGAYLLQSGAGSVLGRCVMFYIVIYIIVTLA